MITVALLASCKAPDKVIGLQKTACFGTCPVYTLDIYSNGQVNLNAEKFVSVGEGSFHLKLSKTDFEHLKQRFSESGFFGFEDQYKAHVTDLPSTFLTFRDGTKSKTIELYGSGPEQLRELAESLQQLVDQKNWKKGKLR